MTDILAKYYEGILNQLRGEVDFINEIFTHQGLKGEGNENALRDLLRKFIPNKYGIGSGIVIDKDGRTSKQSDIVIFDNYNYPEVLSFSSVHIYPVDLVYATIEVKTNIDSEKAKLAIENIKSVRSLNYIRESFRKYPNEPVSEINDDTVLWENINTSPPIGIIFSYRSETQSFKTFSSWFMDDSEKNYTYYPTHVFCLDQGLITSPSIVDKRKNFIFPLVSGDTYYTAEDGEIKIINDKEWVERSGRFYPLTKIGKDKILIDQSKSFLQFATILTELLAKKNISPNINFRENYFSSDLSIIFEISQDEKITLRRK